MRRDFRFAVRGLVQSPAFSAMAIITLALGLGATTAIFSVVNGVLLRPLPIAEPERVVYIRDANPPWFPSFSVSPGNFLTWQREAKTFESMAAMASASLILTGTGEPERIRADRATADIFPLLGVSAVVGRFFRPDEDRPGGEPVVVLAEAFWRRRFGAEASVVGRPLTLSGKPYTVIGVAPARITQVIGDAQAWVPMAFNEQEAGRYGSHFLRAYGRVRSGVTIREATADLDRLAAQLALSFPDTNKGWLVVATPMHEFMVRNVRTALVVLSIAVAFVLLVVCANVASLTLARGLARQRDLAVRVALGAERGRLVREMLMEGLALSCAAGVLGMFVAYGIMRGVIALAPASLPRLTEIGLDPQVVMFALGLVLLAPLLFGLVPAIQVSRTDLRESLAAGGRSVHASLRARTRAALVVGQIALAMVLLVGCALLVQSFLRLMNVDPGFEPRGGVVAALQLPAQRYPEPALRVQFQTQLMDRIRELPGVQSVGLTQSLPLVNDVVASLEVEGRPVAPTEMARTNFYSVSAGFFDAMGIPIVDGRGVTAADTASAPRVIVINETLARQHFANENPIGRRIKVTQGPSEWREIVGVAGDTKQYGLARETPAQVYESYRQQPSSSVELVVRTSLDPAALTGSIRTTIRQMDPDQPIGRVTTLQQLVDTSVGSQRFSVALLTAFAAVALLLAAIGLYGLVAYTASQRTQEIGVRLALGAKPRDILTLVVRQALVFAVSGIAIGAATAFAASRFMESLLFETNASDTATFVTVPLLLLVVVMLASVIPARRAARVDPLVTLRGN